MTDWPAAWAQLRPLDGAASDAEAERLDAIWKTEYIAAFVAYALERPGWKRENAEATARDIAALALATYCGVASPAEAAQIDVRDCEWKRTQAC